VMHPAAGKLRHFRSDFGYPQINGSPPSLLKSDGTAPVNGLLCCRNSGSLGGAAIIPD
jgi:hypothetical protein